VRLDFGGGGRRCQGRWLFPRGINSALRCGVRRNYLIANVFRTPSPKPPMARRAKAKVQNRNLPEPKETVCRADVGRLGGQVGWSGGGDFERFGRCGMGQAG